MGRPVQSWKTEVFNLVRTRHQSRMKMSAYEPAAKFEVLYRIAFLLLPGLVTLSPWRTQPCKLLTQTCEPYVSFSSTNYPHPFLQGASHLIQHHPHAHKRKHGRSLTSFPGHKCCKQIRWDRRTLIRNKSCIPRNLSFRRQYSTAKNRNTENVWQRTENLTENEL